MYDIVLVSDKRNDQSNFYALWIKFSNYPMAVTCRGGIVEI